MPALLETSPKDLIARLGGIPSGRIRQIPVPGTATIEDAIREEGCELIDGTLVEKPVGLAESIVASTISRRIDAFAEANKLGFVSGEQGPYAIRSELVRIPDVAFVSWSRIPGRKVTWEPIPDIVPNLVVEVLSRSNTKAEMRRKRGEYFRAGVELVWMVDIDTETVTVFTSETDSRVFESEEAFDGGGVLPGFSMFVREVFARLSAPE